MREINRIILHCTATVEGLELKASTIDLWHKKRGWSEIGYHYVLYADGTIATGRDIRKKGAHAKGHNYDSVGVAYVGGIDKNKTPKDTMTMQQEMAFLHLVNSLRVVFGDMSVHGHNEFSSKSCPSFDVQEKYKFLNK
ncbi:N-acetylmuramoyl-L-alanine amidase [Pseudoalteromonas sp.]|uniref:N-acetylmuramoyl-L-alanine amidase n=1 Tax=Pseudoalteromonas sp. TaxID=53249 RepID=UPI00261383D4|nr:N-acetylmuramoyl-L-alanine amidase [Pseudoalteromonas sp.]MCP4587455.1 N-acetylmuramoyl-L-alanine amidase [Pseudoalteromonas sp.]